MEQVWDQKMKGQEFHPKKSNSRLVAFALRRMQQMRWRRQRAATRTSDSVSETMINNHATTISFRSQTLNCYGKKEVTACRVGRHTNNRKRCRSRVPTWYAAVRPIAVRRVSGVDSKLGLTVVEPVAVGAWAAGTWSAASK